MESSKSDDNLIDQKKSSFSIAHLLRRKSSHSKSNRQINLPFAPFCVHCQFPVRKSKNRISSQKYSVFDFIPRQLLTQFSKVANLYFLLISVMQAVPGVSPTGRFTTLIPMVVFVGLAMAREGWDDWKRRISDEEENNRTCHVLTCTCLNHVDVEGEEFTDNLNRKWKWCSLKWKDLKEGDIIKIDEGSAVPADTLIMTTSFEDGSCFVETSSLDGESNLKPKQSLSLQYPQNLCNLRQGILHCPPPDTNLYSFDSFIEFQDLSGSTKHPLSINHLLLRGSKVMNTEWVIGMIVFSGEETKIRKNVHGKVRTKVSLIESKLTNRIVIFQFAVVLFLALTSFLVAINRSNDFWYLFQSASSYMQRVYLFFSFVVLYNTLIPISLYFMLETIKLIQSNFINNHITMYDEGMNVCAQARTSSLNEELGQVSLLFCDKTGTLTENRMELKYFLANGKLIGNSIQTDSIIQSSEVKSSTPQPDILFSEIEAHQSLYPFIESLFLCHSVNVSKEDELQGISPEEVACIESGANFNCFFEGRLNGKMSLSLFGIKINFVLIAELAFSSERKRMSVIVEYPNGEIWIHCKGADSVIIERLKNQTSSILVESMNKSEELATLGLRILVYARRKISASEFKGWKMKYEEAQLLIENRKEALELCYEEIERDLEFTGCCAIEDKLQEDVPATIDNMRRAGIKVWVLTGDKPETVVNIAMSSGIIKPSWSVAMISSNSIEQSLCEIRNNKQESQRAFLLNGSDLQSIESNQKLLDLFLDCSLLFDTVICSRVSPIQKAKIVKLVREHVYLSKRNSIEYAESHKLWKWMRRRHFEILGIPPITCAIGDGANDIAMLQEAHLGIGIVGKEGLEAARASDYSIAKFKHLSPLLLVHGHWSYVRTSKFLLGTFYKCGAFFITQFYYQIFTNFSSTSLYESWTLSLFNLLWTSLCVFVVGFLEKDLNAHILLSFPEYYQMGSAHYYYNFTQFTRWIIQGFYHGALVLLFLFFLLHDADLISIGTVLFTALIVVINCKIFFVESSFVTKYSLFAFCMTLVAWIAFQYASSTYLFELHGVFSNLFVSFHFYICVLLYVVAALLPDLLYKTASSVIKGDGL